MNRPNRFLSWSCAAILACAALASTGITSAQTPSTPRQMESATLPEWERLSPAQRAAIMTVVRERWNANPGQRTRMLQHAERWQRMTPEQRQRAEKGRHRWEQMTPQQRKQARDKYELGRDASPEARAARREQLKAMTPEQRREWLRTRRQQGRKP